MKYPVYYTDIELKLNQLLQDRSPSSILVLVDENTKQYCLPILDRWIEFSYDVVEIVAGEEQKTIETTLFIVEQLLKYETDRNAVLINLGGGVIGDMGGFAASIYKRGIDFIQIPTTLLSQVDASVGGKLGIDHLYYKNIIGVFNDPLAVFIHPTFHDTLPLDELYSGFAEMIKHALIADQEHWMALSKLKLEERAITSDIIQQSVSIKREVVLSDPYEQGERKILNFGHTVGHAIESYLLKRGEPITHGYAVVIGMLIECYLSVELGELEKAVFDSIYGTLASFYKPLEIKEEWINEILSLIRQDKKNQNGEVRISTITDIGKPVFDVIVDEVHLIKALREYMN